MADSEPTETQFEQDIRKELADLKRNTEELIELNQERAQIG